MRLGGRWSPLVVAAVVAGALLVACGDGVDDAGGPTDGSASSEVTSSTGPVDTTGTTPATEGTPTTDPTGTTDTTGAGSGASGTTAVPVNPSRGFPATAPRFFTTSTPTGDYLLAIGSSSTVQLPSGTAAPSLQGSSVQLIDVASVADGGQRQWELRAVSEGTSVVRVETGGSEVRWTVHAVR